MSKTYAYVDGSCLGNPGTGGYGVVMTGLHSCEICGSECDTTNNRMELLAAITACQAYEENEGEPGLLEITTDSKYVYNGITKWANQWAKKEWRTASKKAIANKTLWTRLYDLNLRLRPTWHWVQGHNDTTSNEHVLADQLARKSAIDFRKNLKH